MMDRDGRQEIGARTSLQWAMGLASSVAALMLFTLLALKALDVFAFILLCGAVVLLERTVGDWIADRLGDAASKVLLMAFVAVLTWAALGTQQGRAALQAVLRAGYERGFESAMVSIDVPGVTVPLATSTRSEPAMVGPSAVPSSSTVAAGTTNPSLKGDASFRSRDESESPDHRRGGVDETMGTAVHRLTLSATSSTPGAMVLLAQVTGRPNSTNAGFVEFSLNGAVVARLSLGFDGRAEKKIGNLTPGSYSVTARYLGGSKQADPIEDSLLCVSTVSYRVICSSAFPSVSFFIPLQDAPDSTPRTLEKALQTLHGRPS